VVLADYTFQLDSGVVLNTDTLPFVDVQRVVGLDSAPYRETIRDHEGTDGGYIDAEFETGREVIVEGIAYCDVDNAETFFDSLKQNYAPVTTPIPFVLRLGYCKTHWSNSNPGVDVCRGPSHLW